MNTQGVRVKEFGDYLQDAGFVPIDHLREVEVAMGIDLDVVPVQENLKGRLSNVAPQIVQKKMDEVAVAYQQFAENLRQRKLELNDVVHTIRANVQEVTKLGGEGFKKVVGKIEELIAARRQEEQKMGIFGRFWNRLTHLFKSEGFNTDAEVAQKLRNQLTEMKSRQMIDYFKGMKSGAGNLMLMSETIPPAIREQLAGATKEEIEGYAKTMFKADWFELPGFGSDYFTDFVAACVGGSQSQEERAGEVVSALLRGLSQRADFLPLFIDIYRNIGGYQVKESPLRHLLLQKIGEFRGPLAEQLINLYRDANDFKNQRAQTVAWEKLKGIKDHVREDQPGLKELKAVFAEAIVDHYMGGEVPDPIKMAHFIEIDSNEYRGGIGFNALFRSIHKSEQAPHFLSPDALKAFQEQIVFKEKPAKTPLAAFDTPTSKMAGDIFRGERGW